MVCRATTLLQSIVCVAMENWEKICPKHRPSSGFQMNRVCDGTVSRSDCQLSKLAAGDPHVRICAGRRDSCLARRGYPREGKRSHGVMDLIAD
jgi:hypothetical protein